MRPRVVLHSAVSLDGRLDWFSPDIGLYYELISHWHEDATLAGSDTLLKARGAGGEAEEAEQPDNDSPDKRPLLAVPDSQGRIRDWAYWKRQSYWRDVVVLCSRATPSDYTHYLKSEGIDFIVAGDDHVDIQAALGELGKRYGVKQVRVDSGGTLNGVLLRAGLVDEVSVLIHPNLVGGTSPISMFRSADLESSGDVIPLHLKHVETLRGDIVWLRYEVAKH